MAAQPHYIKGYWTTTHKFGIRLPKTVEDALEIDKATNTDFWRKAINKEMAKVKIAWAVNDTHIYAAADTRRQGTSIYRFSRNRMSHHIRC